MIMSRKNLRNREIPCNIKRYVVFGYLYRVKQNRGYSFKKLEISVCMIKNRQKAILVNYRYKLKMKNNIGGIYGRHF